MSDAPVASPVAILRIGTRAFPVEPDRIYVIGSGERADVRIRHDSVAAYHATFSAHAGQLRLEDLGGGLGTWLGDEPLQGATDVPAGARVRLGAIELSVETSDTAGVGAIAGESSAKRPEAGFAELMAEELRRAPWLAASLVLHAAVFLALWLLLADQRFGQPGRRLVAVVEPTQDESIDVGPVAPEAEKFEIEKVETKELQLQDVELRELKEDVQADLPAFDEPASFEPGALGGASMFQRIGGGDGGADILQSLGGGDQGGGFRRTVEGLRESGLEIVFVFDSTGSMGPVLDATKQRLTRMLEALVALVPDARVGVVTYRDHGDREGYLTRSVPLARDLYRSINFMKTVEAGGGGDRPEAVYDGLKAATEQRWRTGARRVVVLVGDAPAHEETDRDIDRLLRRFTRDGHSFVHAIMTSPGVMGGIDPKTRRSFERIAKIGKGICLPVEREESILRQVLTLAIGQDFREQVDRVYELLDTREIPVSRTVRDAIANADRTVLEHLLSRPTVPPELMQALCKSRSLDVAEVLIQALTENRVPEHGRQAAAFALQQMLELPEPPVQVEVGARIGPEDAKRLHQIAREVLK